MLEELAQLGSDEWTIPENGYMAAALARHGYIKRRGKDAQITDKGRDALRTLKDAHQRAKQRQVEAATQDAAEIEFKEDRVIDNALNRKRSAPSVAGIRPMPEAVPAAAQPESSECATDCNTCLPRKALSLIFKKHPEYKKLLDALSTLQEFEE